ncbi:PREDICTED: uncharacterized protein LOC109206608 isoform X2 [Nicotiana attenuata]|uniref:Uncharacterized protein n=1 Tax=Nicotiana attenuata TaxID=49451 RepID=A0A314KUB0_NICAT|nr:PREDICTED: uncharacterized protein LOC109206608 isoform X2 [Nicotiana attenuata]OIT32958.1 hypothetical protein A4A49_20980 [Nicotiana attenuata]
MVSLSFSSFTLVLLFIFLTIKVSIARSQQAKQTFVVVYEAENGFAMELAGSHQSVEKEVLDGVAAAAVLSTGRMVGRKMMIERRNMKQVEASIKSTEEDSKDSGKLLEDATEFLNMMNKDYSGGPGSGSKPRHKPPINNYQPFHRSNP